jgi:hypothetical protein
MKSKTSLMDDSLDAIRIRVSESVTWPNPDLAAVLGATELSVPVEVSDALWRAVQDRRVLLELLDLAARKAGRRVRIVNT